jgi:hypothetical protein
VSPEEGDAGGEGEGFFPLDQWALHSSDRLLPRWKRVHSHIAASFYGLPLSVLIEVALSRGTLHREMKQPSRRGIKNTSKVARAFPMIYIVCFIIDQIIFKLYDVKIHMVLPFR